MTAQRQEFGRPLIAEGKLPTPPCRVFLVPGEAGVLPDALSDIVVDVVIDLSRTAVDVIETFRELAASHQDQTLAVTAPPETLALLLGHVTGADPKRFALVRDSFELAEVGADGRGVLHLLNGGVCSNESAPAADVCRVHLLRHGQSMVVEDGGQVWSHSPIGLTARGHEQARRACEGLLAVNLAAVYTSDLTRAAETAAYVAESHGLTPVVDEALREIALGDFEGMTLARVHERGNGHFVPWLEVTYNEEFPHQGFHHPADLVFPGGESIIVVHERVLDAFHHIVREHVGQTIAIVSHTWVIQPLLAYITGGDPHDYYRFGVRYATDTVLEVPGAGPGKLLKLNADLGLDEVAGRRLSRKGED